MMVDPVGGFVESGKMIREKEGGGRIDLKQKKVRRVENS